MKKQQRFWIWFRYFVMKWRYRLEQSRALFSIATFAALLAPNYVKYIPFFENQGIWGIVELAAIFIVAFIIGGYLYDRVLKLWTETQRVSIERNPFNYVPSPKESNVSQAQWIYNFLVLGKIAEKLEVDLPAEEFIRLHTALYYSLNTKTPDFITEASKLTKLSGIIRQLYLEEGKITNFDQILQELEG